MTCTNTLHLETNGDSSIYLAQPIEFTHEATISVIDIKGEFNEVSVYNIPLFLCCNISEDVFVNSRKLPALCKLYFSNEGDIIGNTINTPIWLKINREKVWKLRLYICDEQGDIPSLGKGQLYCTLQMKSCCEW